MRRRARARSHGPASTTAEAPDGQNDAAGDETGAADDAEEPDGDEASEGDEGSDGAGDAATGLELTTSSGTTALAPTEVYCSGRPGELRHLIGKTNHRLPIVEITPGEFAMVKVGEGRPYKSTSPSGVTVGDESIAFDATALGDATLTGTIACTDWED